MPSSSVKNPDFRVACNLLVSSDEIKVTKNLVEEFDAAQQWILGHLSIFFD